MKKMLAENPSLQVLLDIHRDAEKRENVTTAMIDGVATARITSGGGQGPAGSAPAALAAESMRSPS